MNEYIRKKIEIVSHRKIETLTLNNLNLREKKHIEA